MKKSEVKAAGIADPMNVTVQRDGLNTFALYMELLEFNSKGLFVRQARVLVCQKMLVTQELAAQRTQARWTETPTTDIDDALKRAQAFVGKFGKGDRVAVMRGKPQLVELKGADYEALAKGTAPFAKYTGKFAVDYRVGKMPEAGDKTGYTLDNAITDLAKAYDIDEVAMRESVMGAAPAAATPTAAAATTVDGSTIAPF